MRDLISQALEAVDTNIGRAHARFRRWRMRREASRLDPDSYRFALGEYGIAYYAIARNAVKLGFTNVAGSLMHHALEYFLKAALVKQGTPIADLRDYGHDLKSMWRVVRDRAGEPGLAGHDATIRDVERFESLRYPDRVLRTGMTYLADWLPPAGRPKFGRGMRQLPHYQFVVSEIDALVLDLFRVASLNPIAFRPTGSAGRAAITEWNNFASNW